MMEMIEERILEGWSPEQIAGRFKLAGNSISHGTIYRHIWKNKSSGGSLYKHLRHSGKKYNKRSSVAAGRGYIPIEAELKSMKLSDPFDRVIDFIAYRKSCGPRNALSPRFIHLEKL